MLDLKTQKMLITGGHGFAGRHLLARLRKMGVPAENVFAPAREEADLRRFSDCERAVKGRDVVIHLAGTTGGGDFHKEHPGQIFYDNAIMGIELMEAARKAGVKKFVMAGSATEYPVSAPVPYKEEDVWNGFPEEGHAAYSIAKRTILMQGQAYQAEYGLGSVHLLLANMYGPFAETNSGPVPALIGRIREARESGKPEVLVWGTGNATRDFIYVEDAAEAIVAAAERYEKPDPVNIGSGREVSIKTLAETIARLMGFKGVLRFDPSRISDETRRFLDVSKAEREFGFKARTSFEEGLQKTIEWYNTEHVAGPRSA